MTTKESNLHKRLDNSADTQGLTSVSTLTLLRLYQLSADQTILDHKSFPYEDFSVSMSNKST